MKIPEVLASSDTMAPSGRRAPMAATADSAVRAPVGRSGRKALDHGPVGRRAEQMLGQRLQRRPGRPRRGRPGRGPASLGDEVAGDARDRRRTTPGPRRPPGSGVAPRQLGLRELGQVAQPLDGRAARPPVRARPGTSRTGAWPPTAAATRPAAISPARRVASRPPAGHGRLARSQRLGRLFHASAVVGTDTAPGASSVRPPPAVGPGHPRSTRRRPAP
jgi:hypothetical protein